MIECLSYTPQLGTKPKTQACALTRNQNDDLLLCGTTPNQATLAREGHTFWYTKKSVLNLIRQPHPWGHFTVS